jgi:hypothetical protein
MRELLCDVIQTSIKRPSDFSISVGKFGMCTYLLKAMENGVNIALFSLQEDEDMSVKRNRLGDQSIIIGLGRF